MTTTTHTKITGKTREQLRGMEDRYVLVIQDVRAEVDATERAMKDAMERCEITWLEELEEEHDELVEELEDLVYVLKLIRAALIR